MNSLLARLMSASGACFCSVGFLTPRICDCGDQRDEVDSKGGLARYSFFALKRVTPGCSTRGPLEKA